jgi:hypothetical protein
MSKKFVRVFSALFFISLLFQQTAFSQRINSPITAKRYNRLVIRNAMIVDGSGKPASGLYDIVVENDTITQLAALDPVAVKEGNAKRVAAGEVEIDAAGKYVLPGLINLHGHTQDERGGTPQPVEYCMKMWLACGITTVRDVGAGKKTLDWREQSAKNEIASPRIFAYGAFFGVKNAPEARAKVREMKQAGSHGRRGNQRVGRHQVRHDEHRALVRHPGRGNRKRAAEFSVRLQLQRRG